MRYSLFYNRKTDDTKWTLQLCKSLLRYSYILQQGNDFKQIFIEGVEIFLIHVLFGRFLLHYYFVYSISTLSSYNTSFHKWVLVKKCSTVPWLNHKPLRSSGKLLSHICFQDLKNNPIRT